MKNNYEIVFIINGNEEKVSFTCPWYKNKEYVKYCIESAIQMLLQRHNIIYQQAIKIYDSIFKKTTKK